MDIEYLKGIAILLVVYGHIYHPLLPGYFLAARTAIYAFHMPLFLFVSGYIGYLSASSKAFEDLGAYAQRRAMRLIVPFFFMAAFIVAGKLAMQLVLPMNKPITSIGDSFLSVFINTEQSPVLFIWYLFVVFVFSVSLRFIANHNSRYIYIAFILALIMHVVQVFLNQNGIKNDILYLDRIMMYYVFFMLGCIAARHQGLWMNLVNRIWLFAAVPFVYFQFYPVGSDWRYIVVGTLSIIFLHGLALRLSGPLARSLAWIAQYVFSIYLFNLIFIGFVVGASTRFLSPSDHAVAIILAATICGLAGPILIKMAIDSQPRLTRLSRALQ